MENIKRMPMWDNVSNKEVKLILSEDRHDMRGIIQSSICWKRKSFVKNKTIILGKSAESESQTSRTWDPRKWLSVSWCPQLQLTCPERSHRKASIGCAGKRGPRPGPGRGSRGSRGAESPPSAAASPGFSFQLFRFLAVGLWARYLNSLISVICYPRVVAQICETYIS